MPAVFLVLVSILTACAGAGDPGPATEVELDAFSGRPNPRWTLAGNEENELWNRIASLPPAPAQQEPEHLGYRGFVLRRGTTTARVYMGRIWVRERAGARTLRDSSGVEASLMDAARARGFGDVAR